MLEEARPDLVSVILPDAEHFGPTYQVLEAGISCFAEKPLAMRLDEAEQLVATARRTGTRFGINFNHRYSTPFQRAKQLITEGRLGLPAYLAWKFTGGHFPERQPSLHHLLYMQSHGFDMLRWLGGPVREVRCAAADPRGDGSMTTAAVTLVFASGAVGTLLASVDGSYADTHNHEFECLGLGGRIRVTDVLRRFEWSPRSPRDGITVWEPGFFDDRERDFGATAASHIDRFVKAQLAGEPVPVPAEDGLQALRLGLAAIESARTGSSVRVQPET
jgi:predicted dehydrogenase